MKNYIILLFTLLSFHSFSQEMTIKKLQTIIKRVSDSAVVHHSRCNFIIQGVPFMAIADSTHNRMRIMSPITESNKLTDELKTASLVANFHTALDMGSF